MFQILNEAWWREDITDYLKIRSTLYAIARQLTALAGPVPTDRKEIYSIVSRLFEQIQVVRGRDSP